jgi:3-deoxy-D-manno-octulosonic-acid transferase
MVMLLYSLALTVALVVSAPWWLLRMATTERYREGLWQRLGRVPAALRDAVKGKRVVWVHAVSVGEVLAASRLVGELEAALGEGWMAVVSTTTRTGQELARQRFGEERVFYYPLDFGWAVRAYLLALKPAALVLMESELWPRMLAECSRRGVPVAVVNARVSDRSFGRGTKLRVVWGRALRKVTLWLAQSEEDARRLVAMGAIAESVSVAGNLKYDVRAPKESRIAKQIREWANGRLIIVAGSTCDSTIKKTEHNVEYFEEQLVVHAWQEAIQFHGGTLLVLAPRHPERFDEAAWALTNVSYRRASGPRAGDPPEDEQLDAVLLDTIGDLAVVYGVATVAFVGGSLVKRGGHNPLEPAQFGVPVVIGPSYENFRDVVDTMRAAEGIRVVKDVDGLRDTFIEFLRDRTSAQAMGERGRRVFEDQQGATGRTVAAVVEMIRPGRTS